MLLENIISLFLLFLIFYEIYQLFIKEKIIEGATSKSSALGNTTNSSSTCSSCPNNCNQINNISDASSAINNLKKTVAELQAKIGSLQMGQQTAHAQQLSSLNNHKAKVLSLSNAPPPPTPAASNISALKNISVPQRSS